MNIYNNKDLHKIHSKIYKKNNNKWKFKKISQNKISKN